MTLEELWNAVPQRSLIQLMDSDGLNTVYKDDRDRGKYLQVKSDGKWMIVRDDGVRISTRWEWNADFIEMERRRVETAVRG